MIQVFVVVIDKLPMKMDRQRAKLFSQLLFSPDLIFNLLLLLLLFVFSAAAFAFASSTRAREKFRWPLIGGHKFIAIVDFRLAHNWNASTANRTSEPHFFASSAEFVSRAALEDDPIWRSSLGQLGAALDPMHVVGSSSSHRRPLALCWCPSVR